MSIFQYLPYDLLHCIMSYVDFLEHHINKMICIYHSKIASYRIDTLHNPLYCPYTEAYYCMKGRSEVEIQFLQNDLAKHKYTSLRNYINHKIKQHFMIYFDYTPYLYFGLTIYTELRFQPHLSKSAIYDYLADRNYFF
jgi:hypothetical protein